MAAVYVRPNLGLGVKWGYIDEDGRTAMKFQFDSAGDFIHGLARVGMGGLVGYIDKKGNYVWQ
jgi:hypothetical protein